MITPPTFSKYTTNKDGAIFGRMITDSNDRNLYYSFCKKIKGLFFSGCWFSYGGVGEAAISGKRAAMAIINQISNEQSNELSIQPE